MKNQQVKTLVSLEKEENVFLKEEQEKIKYLQEQIDYVLRIYSKLSINNVRVADGLINPREYLKSLTEIIAKQSPDTRLGKLLDKFSSELIELENYLLTEGKLFRYGLKKRPLMLGSVPVGFIADSLKAHPKFKFGTIDYPIALSKQQIDDYELIPLFVDKVIVKWCNAELKKALEIGITLPITEITYHQGIILIQQMKAASNKLPNALEKHWQTMINRVVSAFGISFEKLI